MQNKVIKIYTDGSCNPQYKIGGWAAIIFNTEEKLVLQGAETNTTHNRMELIAVIKAVENVKKHHSKSIPIKIFTDSQYVERIPLRKKKLVSNNFKTKSGKAIQNVDLIQKLINLLESSDIEFIKVKAHQKSSETANYNREVDKLSRKIVRRQIDKI
ncbi:MAG: ribonuclease HI [Bacteroidales bacterium]|nr:ribonuclease HI [Bacteroidales bacterium]